MPQTDRLGSDTPHLALYLPHRPNNMEHLVDTPSAQALVMANSNHWRKIVTLLAKIASPAAEDWRQFRDGPLFQNTALCFNPELNNHARWHWIGGKDNLGRFTPLTHQAAPLAGCPEVAIDPALRLLLTPYPDYRQLSNQTVERIRAALTALDFYGEPLP